MKLLLTHAGKTYSMTELALSLRWSGDKSAISRQMTASLQCPKGLPVPALGDAWAMEDDSGVQVFDGVILQRDQKSDSDTVNLTAFDRGYWLAQNDATYRFAGATPEAITRTVCGDLGIPIAGLPTTGVAIRRKYAGVKASALLINAWELAGETTGDSYNLRYTPAGLLIEKRSLDPDAPQLADEYNIIDATTSENASAIVDRVVIYDKDGNRLRVKDNGEAQALYGVMSRHITQAKGKAAEADNKATALLRENDVKRDVTVNVVGDLTLLTGKTVTVRNALPGLVGVFWIDADVHEWKNGQHFTKLTLNVKNVMATASVGSDLT